LKEKDLLKKLKDNEKTTEEPKETKETEK